jgi:hypothetical protein
MAWHCAPTYFFKRACKYATMKHLPQLSDTLLYVQCVFKRCSKIEDDINSKIYHWYRRKAISPPYLSEKPVVYTYIICTSTSFSYESVKNVLISVLRFLHTVKILLIRMAKISWFGILRWLKFREQTQLNTS